jgi:hypothetical protein
LKNGVLELPEGGDLETLHCQPSRNFDRSAKLDLTTEPPLLGRYFYATAFVFNILFPNSFNINGLNISSGKNAGKKKNKNILSIGKCQNAQIKYEPMIVNILVRIITEMLVNNAFLFL